jgi:hypothetical protein
MVTSAYYLLSDIYVSNQMDEFETLNDQNDDDTDDQDDRAEQVRFFNLSD